MVTRIFTAGLLGAVAMFAWLFVSHMTIGAAGFRGLPNEASVTSSLKAATGDKGGLYMFPYEPDAMKSKAAMSRYADRVKANGSGMILYRPTTEDAGMAPSQLLGEFVKELVVCIIAAFLLAETKFATLWKRAGFVATIGVVAAIETNASYRIWYGFPGDYTAAQVFMSFVSYVVAGVAIGWWLKPAPLKPID
jgi:hypothetical protein